MSGHVLAFVEDSARARDVTTVADEVATKMGAALTVVAVAVIEQVRPRCCDLGSGVWNRLQRELAAEQLESARQQLAARPHVSFVMTEGGSVEDALACEAGARDSDVIVVPDQPRSVLPWSGSLPARLRRRVDGDVFTPREHSARATRS